MGASERPTHWEGTGFPGGPGPPWAPGPTNLLSGDPRGGKGCGGRSRPLSQPRESKLPHMFNLGYGRSPGDELDPLLEAAPGQSWCFVPLSLDVSHRLLYDYGFCVIRWPPGC